MARARTIKPGFFTNELLAECSPFARILFAGLWCIADREGRLEDRPRKIRAELLPYEAGIDADALLSELAARGFVTRYEVEGTRYLCIPEFHKHQNVHPREVASVIPEPRKGEPLHGKDRPFPKPAGQDLQDLQDPQGLRVVAADDATKHQPAPPAAAPPAPVVAEEGRGTGLTGKPLPSSPPTTVERLRGAVSAGLGVIGPGGGGLSLGDGRRVGELIRNANAAVKRCGFEAVVEALVSDGQQAVAKGRAPETMTFFTRTLAGLADPDARAPPTGKPTVTAPASPQVKHGGGQVAL